MALGAVAKACLLAGFLTTGSINTLTKKWQFQTCGPTTHPTTADDRAQCPPGEKPFHKPWTQNIQMFVGEALVISLFVARQPARARQGGEAATAKAPFYIFLLPACCDILGTGVGGVGMLYITASVWQMMRGSLIIFTSLLSVLFLNKKLHCYNWLAVIVSATGLLLVGCSAILDEGNKASSNVPLGIFLTVVSQIFAASQMVVEELFVKGYKALPEQVVGCEGLWGVLMMLLVLTVMYNVPGNDAGSYENALDSIHMLGGSSRLLVFVLCYLASISFFNFFGVTISGKLSAVHRTINDALRTFIIWTVEIIVFYGLGSERYGTAWSPHSWLQLIGFSFLILGNLINHKVVKCPCLRYPLEGSEPVGASVASLGRSGHGVSLVNAAEESEATAA